MILWDGMKNPQNSPLMGIIVIFSFKMLGFCNSLCAWVLNKIDAPPTSHEWVGLYKNLVDVILERVACGGYLNEPTHGSVQSSEEFMDISKKKYTDGLQYFTVTEVKPNDCIAKPSVAFLEFVTWVHVVKFHADVLRCN